jgi:CRP-like cAMP-binding protein/KaiC/GvpD/RAD55 family RecA-like ATPase
MPLANLHEVPKNSLILLVGPPGAGKSIFCHRVVLNALAIDRPTIFVTTEQSPSGIIDILSGKGMDKPVPSALSFIDAFAQTVGLASPERSDTICANCEDLNSMSMAISKLQLRISKADILLVFDSLTSPYLFNKEELLRFIRLCLVKFVAEGNAVIALMDEGCGKSEDLVAMMSIADGVIKIVTEENKQLFNVVKHPILNSTRIEVPLEVKQGIKTTTHFDPRVMKQFLKSMIVQDETKVEAFKGKLRGIPLFSSLSADDLSILSRQLRKRHYRKGDIIFHKDDFGSTFHIISIGNVKLSIPSKKGEDVLLAHLGPGDFFGEFALLDDKPRSATATAIEYTETLALEREDFLDFLKRYTEVAICMLSVLTQRIRTLNSQLENIISIKPDARLAKTLLKLMKNYGNEIPQGWELSIPLTQSGLAEMIGVDTTTIKCLLHELQVDGIINKKAQKYIINKPEELQKRASQGTN